MDQMFTELVQVMTIAQASPVVDPVLTTTSGWVGTGLLGSVLAWLMFVHLPAKDKQINGILERHDKQVVELITRERDHLRDARDSHARMLKQVVDHCHDEGVAVRNEIRESTQALVSMQQLLEEMRESLASTRKRGGGNVS